MKIGFVIGALNPGGAERQLVDLAVGLLHSGHEIEVLAYDGEAELDSVLKDRGIKVVTGRGRHRYDKFRLVKSWIARFQPNIIQGFMKRASSLAILAKIRNGDASMIATDYSTATYGRRQLAFLASTLLFKLADRIVTETVVNRRNLVQSAPWLKSRVDVIRNGVHLDKFSPEPAPNGGCFSFLSVGTVWRAKNPVALVRAAAIVREKSDSPFQVRWVGRFRRLDSDELTPEYVEAIRLVEDLGLQEIVQFAGPTNHVEMAYHSADVLLHPSIQDGIPNAVVEGMASGLPIVVSPVSDLPMIVEEGNNGFVSDGFDAESIAAAMLQMLETSPEERASMGRRSRELAERWFGMDRFVAEYEALYRNILGRDS